MLPIKRLLLLLWALTALLLTRETVCEMNGEDALYQYNVYAASLEECLAAEMQNSLPDDGSPRCNRTWDTILCWDEARVNTTAKLPCPSVHLANPEAPVFAYKTCWPNGTFSEWTNYTLCTVHTEGEPTPVLQYLRIVYSIGYSLSLLALVIAMAIFSYFKKLRCPRNTIHMHLFMSFILRAVFMFVRDIIYAVSVNALLTESEEHDDYSSANGTNVVKDLGCDMAMTIVITICQYALVSNYYWLLVEGVYLHALITLAVFSESSSLKLYIILGWGVPLLFVVPWVIVQEYTHEEGCWFAQMTEEHVYWIIKAPVMVSVVINFILFLNILRVLATKLNATNAAEARSKLAKSTLVLIPLFGVYYIVTIGMYATENKVVVKMRMYIELGLSSFQGFLVAVLYCFMNGEVRSEIRRKWRVRQLNRTLSTHRSLRNGHSRSSFSTPSRQDSLKEPLKDSTKGDKNSIRAKLRALKRQAFGGSYGLNGHHMGNGNMARPSQTAVSEIDNESDSDRPRVTTEALVVRHPDPNEPNENTKMNVHHTDNTPTVIIDEVKDSDGYEADIYNTHDSMDNEIEVEIDHEASGSCSSDGCHDGGCDDRRVYPNIETEV
ncbi:vasoactive intestinal polypeptide receptor-like isoform X2 [Asterias amurensis]|uniref:vasoactive intestinal polypeptide receptor-like isoform X2 n=1 Tax=Asterias amurensis TaxID=7602 RepID=UPI003AB24F0B